MLPSFCFFVLSSWKNNNNTNLSSLKELYHLHSFCFPFSPHLAPHCRDFSLTPSWPSLETSFCTLPIPLASSWFWVCECVCVCSGGGANSSCPSCPPGFGAVGPATMGPGSLQGGEKEQEAEKKCQWRGFRRWAPPEMGRPGSLLPGAAIVPASPTLGLLEALVGHGTQR